ncbi:MAG TPA: hypothetical protein VLA75_01730 [Thermoanaerobaculia bacterium]|nr:hypothetical protein [Thermoanaerobaculia bacterium]
MGSLVGDEGSARDPAVVAGEAAVDEVGAEGGIEGPGAERDAPDAEALLDAVRVRFARRALQRTVPVGGRHERPEDDGVAHAAECALEDPAFPLLADRVEALAAERFGVGEVAGDQLAVLGREVGILPQREQRLALAGEGPEGVHHRQAVGDASPRREVGELRHPLARVEAEGGVDPAAEEARAAETAEAARLEVLRRGEHRVVPRRAQPVLEHEHVLEVLRVGGGVQQRDRAVGAERLDDEATEVALPRQRGPGRTEQLGDPRRLVEAAGDVLVELRHHPAAVLGREQVVARALQRRGGRLHDERQHGLGDAERAQRARVRQDTLLEADEGGVQALGDAHDLLVVGPLEDEALVEDQQAAAGVGVPLEPAEAQVVEQRPFGLGVEPPGVDADHSAPTLRSRSRFMPQAARPMRR